ncbi:hypothetical protein MKX01_042828 [Papaver californicum]|nr:hypothetical protein MKX01_042828 [Papaver californicum]
MITPSIQALVIYFLFNLLSLSSRSDATSSGKLVTYLPGLAVQPLPFHLETGYIGVGNGIESLTYKDDNVHEMFYYFVKSERNPKEDPLVLWLAGGPFCSGLNNLAIGIGPIEIDKVVEYNNGSLPTLTLNPNSWSKLISGVNEKQVMEPQCDNTLIPSINPKEMIENKRRSLVKIKEGLVAEKHLLPPSCLRDYGKVLLEYWANDHGVRKALHIKEGTTKKWARCNRNLKYGSELESCLEYHHNISTKGYRSLIFNGDLDTVVPHISTEAWIRTLANLSITDDWRPWSVSGQVAGYTRTYSNGLTYATVKASGHSAPAYKPEQCYAMFERWISNTPL